MTRRLLSYRAYARHRAERGLVGQTHTAVGDAVRSGRITAIDGKIDPEVADIQWAEKTDAVQQARGARGGHAPKFIAPTAPKPPAPEGEGREGYFDAKARRERAEAQLAELELRKATGELVVGAEAESAAFGAFRALRDRLLGVSDRIAAILAAESDAAKVHAILDGEIKAALRDVASGLKGE